MSAIPAVTIRTAQAIDVARIRADFPILNVKVNDKPLAYLDSAASAQMPQQVIDRLTRYHTSEHANIHRGVHYLSEKATDAYEAARAKVRKFINAAEDREVIITRGTTNAINTVAHGFGRAFVGEGDERFDEAEGARRLSNRQPTSVLAPDPDLPDPDQRLSIETIK